MTSSTDASIKEALARHLRPKLRRMEKSMHLPRTKTKVDELASETYDIAISSPTVAEKVTAGLDPAVVEKRDQYLLLFENYQQLIRMKVAQGAQLARAIELLGELEFVTETNRGRTALGKARGIHHAHEDLFELDQEITALCAKLMLIPTDEDFRASEELGKKLQKRMESFAGKLTTTAEAVQDMIESEAIKAWVKKHPDKAHDQLKRGLWAVDQVLNGVEFAGETVGQVPTEYTKAVGLALTLFSRVAKAGKAVINKAILSADAERQMANYREANVGGDIFDEHNKDPMLMAEMLAKKKKAEVDLIIALASPLIQTAADQIPGLSTAWKAIQTAITSTVDAYLEERLALAREQLGQARKPGDLPLEYAKAFGQQFKENIFSVLAPWEAAKDAAVKVLADRLSKLIMEHLPIDPAQTIDGDALQESVNQLGDAFMTHYHRKGVAEKAKHDYPRPTEDKDGHKVTAILSDIQENDGGEPYLVVRVDLGEDDGGVQLGSLMLKTLVFDADMEFDVTEKVLIQFLPEKDSRGRTVDEVRMADGLMQAREHDTGSPNAAYYARIGDVWGYLDQPKPHQFHPRKPEASGFVNWSKRIVTKTGFREADGTEVTGAWHKPWPEQQYYVLVLDDGSRQWAHGSDTTGRGGGTRYDVRHVLKDGKGLAAYEL